ncbi:lipoprotein [Actinoplanes ianthinogenes]|nr:lipoprotein [Actinoplanes ianthinogenes]
MLAQVPQDPASRAQASLAHAPQGSSPPRVPPSKAQVPEGTPRSPARITYPAAGHEKFAVASGETAAPAGKKGELLHYQVAVERDIHGVTADEFARTVTATLRDPRSWTAGGEWRLQRVGPGDRADFVVRLVTPKTRDALCAGARDGYTSCRSGDKVVVNVARWVKGVPGYGAGLDAYRQYVINHEVGHRLHQAHELCPGKGDPAPVMQQQTLGLHGCTANAWPFLNGDRYRGRIGAYDDNVPPRDKGNP